jgi:hypothetical protein
VGTIGAPVTVSVFSTRSRQAALPRPGIPHAAAKDRRSGESHEMSVFVKRKKTGATMMLRPPVGW